MIVMTKKHLLKRAWIAGSIGIGLAGPLAAVEKEVSLVTKQPLGALAVAGRLSIDLHAEFMLSRSYETETALNWYNCGYSGGGAGGTKVGGNFGHFGFQVPFEERELRYPRAVTVDQVRAVRFDGDDFLKGNIAIEPKILESGNMALELWFRSENPAAGGVILGWQSVDGRESSAPLVYPPGFKGSGQWRHLVVNCTRQQEDWYLDGVKVAGIPRRMTVKDGHVMVLGGSDSAKPSFKGELVAVRLHDETMTVEEITHNFKGGVGLGTEMHNWWRNEPDKWWIAESAHFRHAVDKEEMKRWTEQQLKEFHQRVPEMFELAELCYQAYSERLALRSSVVSVLPEERGDGIKYKVPIQPSEGSWMGFDGHFGWACQGAGFINPHELVHGWQAMTGNMAGNYWEVHANFPQTYVGIYQTIPVIMAEASAFPANGRTYYHDRTMLEHLAQTPEYGPMFISKLWYDGPGETEKTPYPWTTFERINPYADRTLADEFTRMAMRNVTWDYKTFKEFKPGENYRDPQEAVESPYRRTAEANRTDIYQSLLRSRVLLEPVPHEPDWWRVPKEQAPQQLGWNICPLKFKPGKVTALLEGYVDTKRGGDWRAGFVGVDAAGKPVYGRVFQPGKAAEFDASPGLKELYLVVCATPAKIIDIPMTGDFRSFEQEQFPYKVKLGGCDPLDVMAAERPQVAGKPHPNGGGLVEHGAEVEASAFVGPNARVLGRSKVLGDARIEDYAVVRDSTVKDQAVVCGHALVCEESTVSGRAKVRDYAVVKGRTTVTGDAKILEHAVIATQKTCSDLVVVKGISSVYGGNQSGTAMIDGFYAKGNEITKGKWFTWSWGQGKNPGEVDENFGGLYADYDFNQEHGWMARDAFGATWGYLVNGARVVARSDNGSNGDADGALLLNGKDQFVELRKDVADMANCTYTAEVMWDGAGEGTRIFEFAAANGDAVCLTPAAAGRMVFAIRKGDLVESVSAPALQKGVWTTVQVMMDGDTASLFVNGAKAGEKTGMKLRPDSIRATHCYLGRGLKGDFFGGSIGRFAVHSVALVDKVPPSPDPAAFEMAPMFTSPGSLVMTAKPGSDPLGVVEYWFEEEGGKWNSGWTTEPTVHLEGRNAARPLLYRLKMRDKGGNETRFSEPARSGGFPKGTRILTVGSGAPAVIEAENHFAAVPAIDGTTVWEKRADVAGFAGEGFMAVPDRGVVNEPFSAAAARLDYAVQFTRPGSYFLWVRGNGNNDGGASIHAGFGLKPADWGLNLRTGNGRYAWTRSPAFRIDKPGTYLFSIWMREDGAMMDRLIFTSSESFEPSPDQRAPDNVMTGEGPSESTLHTAR
jgi:carbonic anhydrase/acetyltransferase-like protein (isoleucine patch superfamily)